MLLLNPEVTKELGIRLRDQGVRLGVYDCTEVLDEVDGDQRVVDEVGEGVWD